MCSCGHIEAKNVIIPAETNKKGFGGKLLKSKRPSCNHCNMPLNRRQLYMIERKGYYSSTDPD